MNDGKNIFLQDTAAVLSRVEEIIRDGEIVNKILFTKLVNERATDILYNRDHCKLYKIDYVQPGFEGDLRARAIAYIELYEHGY